MINKSFPESNIIIAEGQEEYNTVVGFLNKEEGSITLCFELDDDELNRLKATNELYIKILTGGGPMQPIASSLNKEDLIPIECLK